MCRMGLSFYERTFGGMGKSRCTAESKRSSERRLGCRKTSRRITITTFTEHQRNDPGLRRHLLFCCPEQFHRPRARASRCICSRSVWPSVTEGFAAALERKKRATPPKPSKLDGEGAAKMMALRLGKPPVGSDRWSLQLLADELVALEVVDSICPETVRKMLNQFGMTKRKIEIKLKRLYPKMKRG